MGKEVPSSPASMISPLSQARAQPHFTQPLLAGVARSADMQPAAAAPGLGSLVPSQGPGLASPLAPSADQPQSQSDPSLHEQRQARPTMTAPPSDPAMAMVLESLRSLHAKVDSLQDSYHSLWQQVRASDQFMPLVSLAITQLVQQMHNVQQVQLIAHHQGPANRRSRPMGLLGEVPAVDLSSTPARKQAGRADRAQRVAIQQQQAAQHRAAANGRNAMQPHAPSALVSQAAPLPAGLKQVYPGKDGEEQWDRMAGQVRVHL